MARVGVDAGFMIGLYDETDGYHEISLRHFEELFGEYSARHQLVIPWPILYESCGTRQAKSFQSAQKLLNLWSFLRREGQLILLDDAPFRDKPLEEHLDKVVRPMSLVDRVLRAVILNQERQFDYFLTYNTGDFADACKLGGIHLLNERSSADSYGI
jgi:predicted nucleic acid-binding protein